MARISAAESVSRLSHRSLLAIVSGLIVTTGLLALAPPAAEAASLEEMSLERWAKLREAERFQLNVAEKYYREKNYKVALTEYEKFLTLYESSEGASYSQLKWSLCLVQLKKLNTAISDGFQSVIDYWPESPEATAAAFYIGRTYKNIGEVRKARKAYLEVLEKHPKHLVSVYSLTDMADIASITKKVDDQVEAWQKLTFDFERNRDNARYCENASRSLAQHCFANSKLTDGVEALATTYSEVDLPRYVVAYARTPISAMTGNEENRSKGEKLADQAVAWIREQTPTGTEEEEVTRARRDWYLAADIQVSSRRPEKVVETYADILKKFGPHDETFGRLATFHKSQKDYNQARVEYGKYENKIEGNSQIATSYRDELKYDLAVTAYRKNLALDDENQVKWNGLIADTLRDGRKFTEALAVYTGLIQDDPENSETWLGRIAYMYHYRVKDYKKAIGYYRQCNNFPTNYYNMADCNRKLKQWREAIILYGQIMGGSESHAPQALWEIGRTHELAADKEKAITSFQQVCKRFPKTSYASTAHAHLQDKYKITVTLGGAKDE